MAVKSIKKKKNGPTKITLGRDRDPAKLRLPTFTVLELRTLLRQAKWNLTGNYVLQVTDTEMFLQRSKQKQTRKRTKKATKPKKASVQKPVTSSEFKEE